MRIQAITSRSNPALKAMRKAVSGEAYVLLEGAKMISEALRSQVSIEQVLVDESRIKEYKPLLESISGPGIQILSASSTLVSSVSNVVTTQGVLALAKPARPHLHELSLSDNPLLVVTDSIQDPGNLGAMVRSAAAFSADAVIVLKGSSNPFSAKAVRGSAGTCFRIPVVQADAVSTVAWLQEKSIRLVGLEGRGSSPLPLHDFDEPCAIIVGNEGSGISTFLRKNLDTAVMIPMAEGVESLNAAAAVAIALYEARHKREPK